MKRTHIRMLSLLLAAAVLFGIFPVSVTAACSHKYERIYTTENAKMHSYISECTRCGQTYNGSGYAGWENHEYDRWGECISCGYCSHSNIETTYSFENNNMHSFASECENCGKDFVGGSYSGWEEHSFWGDECELCGYVRKCGHYDSDIVYEDLSYNEHYVAYECNDCGVTYNSSTEEHEWDYGEWDAVSETEHEREYFCVGCGHSNYETEDHNFYYDTCDDCGFTRSNDYEDASVTLYAEGPDGELYSAGGEIAADYYPASYTVAAEASGCEIEKIIYTLNGRTKTVYSDSVTITAETEDEFETSTFTAYTDTGLTATFTVNFKYYRKNTTYYMWATSHEATIRSITGNGLNKTLAYTMTIPNSYDGQTNLTDEQIAEIQNLIGRSDGKVYTVNYTRVVTVYTPAELSYTGADLVHGSFDGNDPDEIEDCLSRWEWNTKSAEAIRQAAKSSLTFTTGTLTDCTAIWIDSTTDRQLYELDFGGEIVSPSQSRIVSVSYSDFPDSDAYVYDYLEYSGDTTGTSSRETYSQSYMSYSDPLTVTFYCYPDDGDPYDPVDPADPTTGNVTVYIRDADSHALLADAYVWSDEGYDGYTSRNGYVEFYDLEFGRYTFEAEKSGYYDGSETVKISADDPEPTVTIYLTPIDAEEFLGSIRVYVRDIETDEVIEDATVFGVLGTKTTNSSGYVTYYDVEDGRYTFVGSADGYDSQNGTAEVEDSSGVTITIYLYPDEGGIEETGNIRVYVRDIETTAIIPGATVFGVLGTKTTNSSGYVTFYDVEFGRYTFVGSADGYDSQNGTAELYEAETVTVTIYLYPDEAPAEGEVTVFVRDAATLELISGATVTGNGTSGTTGVDGYRTFTNLPFGGYNFTASKAGYSSNSVWATIDELDPTTSITIYLEPNNADVSISANAINGTVYRGSTIMVAATVTGDTNTDFTPTLPLTVTMKATRNGGSVFDTQSQTVICPKGESNLVWFAVGIPASGYSGTDVTFTFEVSTPAGYTDTNTSNNTSSKTATTYVLPDRSTPDASFELEPPSAFTNSPYKTTSAPTRTWSVWEWNSGFVKKTYEAKLTTSANVTPDSTAVWKEEDSGKWTTRSGYGLNTSVSVSLTGIPSTMFTGNAKVNSYYPEFNYSTSANSSNMLLRESEDTDGYSATFTFPADGDSISGGKMHKTPIWFPDGEYSIKYEVYDLWTPSGVLTASTYAIIDIKGSMYDDYYTNRG